MEAVISCDILNRAGVKVVRASVESDLVLLCANGMRVFADVFLEDIKSDLSGFDIIILPGGLNGSQTFCKV